MGLEKETRMITRLVGSERNKNESSKMKAKVQKYRKGAFFKYKVLLPFLILYHRILTVLRFSTVVWTKMAI